MRFLHRSLRSKKGGYKRHSTQTELGEQTVAGVLQQYVLQVSNNKTFVCQRCFSQPKAITRHQNVFLKRKDGPKPSMVTVMILKSLHLQTIFCDFIPNELAKDIFSKPYEY